MYAIVRAGGRQEKVAVGDEFEVNRLAVTPGDTVTLPALLVVRRADRHQRRRGSSGVTVTAEIVSHHRGEKINILRYKNKTGYRRRQGHRQDLTRLRVTGIETGSLTWHTRRAPSIQERPRQQLPAARREALRRPGRRRGRDHRAPARHPLPPGPERRPRGDDTLFALAAGTVEFGTRRGRRVVNIVTGE